MVGLYTVVPTRYGNLYMDSFNIVWAVILSYLSNRQALVSSYSVSQVEKGVMDAQESQSLIR